MQLRVIFILLAGILLVGCQSGFVDTSRDLPVRVAAPLSTSQFFNFAWVDNQTFVIVDNDSFPQMWFLDTNTQEKTSIHIETTCKRPFVRDLQRLPDQSIGFILSCNNPKTEIFQRINRDTNSSSNAYIEPTIRYLGSFNYSANMKELILLDVQDVYLESSIYHVGINGERKNITPEFLRAYHPDWSSKNNLVAFFGTKPYPGSDDEIKHFSETEKLLDYPWRVYLYNPEDLTIKEIPIDVIGPNGLKWSPDGKTLAFSGAYKRVPGMWLVSNLENPDNLIITRVVDGLGIFDFSPDGKSMAFAYTGLQNKEKQNKLYVVSLPDT